MKISAKNVLNFFATFLIIIGILFSSMIFIGQYCGGSSCESCVKKVLDSKNTCCGQAGYDLDKISDCESSCISSIKSCDDYKSGDESKCT